MPPEAASQIQRSGKVDTADANRFAEMFLTISQPLLVIAGQHRSAAMLRLTRSRKVLNDLEKTKYRLSDAQGRPKPEEKAAQAAAAAAAQQQQQQQPQQQQQGNEANPSTGNYAH